MIKKKEYLAFGLSGCQFFKKLPAERSESGFGWWKHLGCFTETWFFQCFFQFLNQTLVGLVGRIFLNGLVRAGDTKRFGPTRKRIESSRKRIRPVEIHTRLLKYHTFLIVRYH